ncbi:ABC transporter ATP-binding protein [Anaerocolumna sp. MB42-C2]|uniref:ABC transporter ATP-binding protein n=1 Tax=Anaerocolumna sp. MB42-C2 TaxID=3070997 RepID=UPI0027E1F9C3|nr:oligopeptide/dipeptide ABC transporter ATP-binding protein [Anaerocolumna sp. MB42-C2]WMJ90604.1 ATP-binding cassette domain-containing protein [Anaerocolumna sp. MB42-C2]
MPETILKVKEMSKTFSSKKVNVKAVNNVSFEVKRGETVGIVGESGCGKTTLGRCIVRAIQATAGDVLYLAKNGQEYDIQKIDKKTMKSIRKEIQMIFQDPFSSLDPRMTVYDIISEPLKANFKMSAKEIEERVKTIAEKVGLNPSYLKRYPHAFSGGQRQRIGIARALVLYPRLIVCDEAVSALDVSVQAQVVNLLRDLQEELHLTYLFISHDLSVIEHISDKVGVMYLGKMVEYASSEDLFKTPFHPYTEALLSAVPIADPTVAMERIPLQGEIPNPANPPSGCFFHTRCKYCIDKCKTDEVEFIEKEPEHFVACQRANELHLQGIVH